MNVGPSVLQSPSERFCNCHLKRLWGFLDKADSLPVKLNRSLLLKLQRLFCAWRTSERQPSNYFDKSSEHTHSAWSPTRSVTPPKWQPPSEPVLLSAGLWADPSPEWSIPHLYGHLLCRVPRHHPSTQHYSQKQLQWWGWKRYSAHGLFGRLMVCWSPSKHPQTALALAKLRLQFEWTQEAPFLYSRQKDQPFWMTHYPYYASKATQICGLQKWRHNTTSNDTFSNAAVVEL